MSKTDVNKSDADLGSKINEMLVEMGIETPMIQDPKAYGIEPGPAYRKTLIAAKVKEIMELLRLDLSDDSLCDTPDRVSKMFLNELFWGLDYGNFPKATVVDNKMNYNEMVMERTVNVQSTCEHHLLPILGNAWVAYIPNKKVLGLSKLNRIVEFFSRRPQIQERLTVQIHATLCYLLETADVAVVIAAEHMCVKTRGVEDACSDTVTSKMGGRFLDTALRAEFFSATNLTIKS